MSTPRSTPVEHMTADQIKEALVVKVVAHLLRAQLMNQLIQAPKLSLSGEQCVEVVNILSPFVAGLVYEARKCDTLPSV